MLQQEPHLLPRQVWEPKSFPQRELLETGCEGDGVDDVERVDVEDDRVDVKVDRVEVELERVVLEMDRVDVELEREDVRVESVLLRCVDVDRELLRCEVLEEMRCELESGFPHSPKFD